MNNILALSPDKPRTNSVEYLITVGLGYCCEAFFWERYVTLPADVIAARLGCTADTVRRHRQWHREGLIVCQRALNCIPKRRSLFNVTKGKDEKL